MTYRTSTALSLTSPSNLNPTVAVNLVWNRRKSSKLNVLVVSGSSAALDLLCPVLDQQPNVSCTRFDRRRLSAECSAEQYLINNQFEAADNPSNVICVGFSYADVERCNLWEFIAYQARLGDFCVVHVEHNPLLIALAELRVFDLSLLNPESFNQLSQYVCQCERILIKLNTSARDRFVLSYTELLLDYRRSCRRILTYLEQQYDPGFPPLSSCGSDQLRSLLRLQVGLHSQRELLSDRRDLVPYCSL